MSAQLSARRRLVVQALAWALIVCAGPGLLAPDGFWMLAIAGLALWSSSAARPGPRAFLVEWLVAAVAWAVVCGWAAYVFAASLLFIGLGLGLYSAAAAALLRRIAPRFPLALAAPAAWVGLETLRTLLEPPFGFSWMRLGVHLHSAEWIAGSARVWGVVGLSWLIAALGGALADAWNARVERTGPALRRPVLAACLGVGPLLAGVCLARFVEPPLVREGPRVMLVQPGIPQWRKMQGLKPGELFRLSRELTESGLAEARARGEPAVDLVCWGETMLGIPLMDPELAAAVRAGARSDVWSPAQLDESEVDAWLDIEENWIGGGMFGKNGVLPEGTSFLSGAELSVPRDGRIRRLNAIVMWGPDARRAGQAAKRHLVPSAETMLGLERFEWVRKCNLAIGGYVPDLLGAEATGVLELAARDGARWRFSGTVCFDNAFDGPYTSPLRAGPVDFHLVVSNEAWYRQSWEADQMLAFSRLIAIETGRSVVRATNSGVSAVVGPDGRELARLAVGGRDREVSGSLRATVPVPLESERSRTTPYVRWEPLWLALALAAPAALLLAAALGNRKATRG